MKHTHGSFSLVILCAAVLLCIPQTLADESESYRNNGSFVDTTLPQALTSESYSVQDITTGWHAAPGDSESYQAIPSNSSQTDESSSGGESETASTSGGGSDTGSNGHGRGRRNTEDIPVVTVPQQPTQLPAHPRPVGSETPSVGEGTVSQDQRPSMTEEALHGSSPAVPGVPSALQPIAQSVRELFTRRPGESLQQWTSRTLHAAAAGVQESPPVIGSLSVTEGAVALRLVGIGRSTSLLETLPAYQAVESAGAPLLALRPGGVQIGALFTFFRRRKKKLRRV